MNNKVPRRVVQVAVPILLALIIGGIWLAKNSSKTIVDDTGSSTSSAFPLLSSEPPDMDTLTAYGLPIMLEFSGDGCPACEVMAPILEELHEELEGRAIIVSYDVWDDPDLADGYPLSVIPTQYFFYADGTPYVPETNADQFTTYTADGRHSLTKHEGLLSKEELLIIFKELGMKG